MIFSKNKTRLKLYLFQNSGLGKKGIYTQPSTYGLEKTGIIDELKFPLRQIRKTRLKTLQFKQPDQTTNTKFGQLKEWEKIEIS